MIDDTTADLPRHGRHATADTSHRHRPRADGVEGNERLTVACGVLLILLFAALGVTILRVHALLWLHMFLGCVILGPVALKLGSVGYRFGRYYSGHHAYRERGVPALHLRGLAPLLVLATLAVFATGGTMLLLGPASRPSVLLLHKLAFVAWIALVAMHVLAHLPDILRVLTGGSRGEHGGRRRAARRARTERGGALAAALVGGVVLALALSGLFAPFASFHG